MIGWAYRKSGAGHAQRPAGSAIAEDLVCVEPRRLKEAGRKRIFKERLNIACAEMGKSFVPLSAKRTAIFVGGKEVKRHEGSSFVGIEVRYSPTQETVKRVWTCYRIEKGEIILFIACRDVGYNDPVMVAT